MKWRAAVGNPVIDYSQIKPDEPPNAHRTGDFSGVVEPAHGLVGDIELDTDVTDVT